MCNRFPIHLHVSIQAKIYIYIERERERRQTDRQTDRDRQCASVLQKDMYANCRDFKTFPESERYFEFVDIKCFRDYLVKLRLGLLPLNTFAFNNLSSRDTVDGCDYCGEFEDEKHLIRFCP